MPQVREAGRLLGRLTTVGVPEALGNEGLAAHIESVRGLGKVGSPHSIEMLLCLGFACRCLDWLATTNEVVL